MEYQNLIDVVIYLGYAALAIVILVGLGWLAWRLYQAKLKPQIEEELEQQEAITAMDNLAGVLAQAEQDSNKAGLLLVDANTYAQSLVNLVQGIALKAEAMQEETDVLNKALEAIASQDPLKIAQAGGQIKDEHIRTLMFCKVRNAGYWQDTAILIGAQMGTLQQWERGYRTFASNLLSEVGKAKSQLASLTAALELTGTSRPLLQIQASLNDATGYLQLERRPGLYQAAKELPTINAGLLLK